MKKMRKIVITLALLIALPLAAQAMNHEGMNHAGMKGMEGMKMSADMIMLPQVVVDGVAATAHLKDVSKAMSKMGMEQTHHLMVMFVNQTTGEAIDSGSVAVRVIKSSGAKSEPVRLMPMEGQFGADVTLSGGTMYTLEVGSKLVDGKKRQFKFMYHPK
ncbi:MAG: hypothetical protein RQ724_10060 [Desulfuromonadales bacterium]|nr:hypothetical protein [Desulfuromonadales bacterium]